MTEKTLTTENIKPALDALRGELAPWPVVAKKQDRLNPAQLNAANSGITSSLVAQIIANTAAIRALESAITGTGLRALVVASLPAVGTTGILYIVPVTTYDPDTDADVVNYSNEYIWIPVDGGTASEGHYEQVGQTGIVINNGQLTITVNGTSVGTFTANQSGDTTAAITVPTNADYVDRTTDQTVAGKKTWTGEQSFTLPIVGSITGTASKAIADEDGTSIKTGYVNVAGNQTVSGNKEFTGSNTFNNILPNATNTYSLGSSSYQWSSVYAQSYYYNGAAWGLDKANTWTQNQIIASSNDKSYYVKDTIYELGQSYSNGEHLGGLTIQDKNGSVVGLLDIVDRSYGDTEMRIRVQQKFDPDSNNRSTSGTTLFNEMTLGISSNKVNFVNFNADLLGANKNLGTSTNKWKTLNGVNPGALSLPSSSYVELDTTNWDKTGATSQSYTPAVHGWLYISIQNIAGNYLSIVNGRGAISIDGTGVQSGLRAMLPAIANESVSITVKTDSIFAARFYPMLGNV